MQANESVFEQQILGKLVQLAIDLQAALNRIYPIVPCDQETYEEDLPVCDCSTQCAINTYVQRIIKLERTRSAGGPLKVSPKTGWNELREVLEETLSQGRPICRAIHRARVHRGAKQVQEEAEEQVRRAAKRPATQEDQQSVGQVAKRRGRPKRQSLSKIKKM